MVTLDLYHTVLTKYTSLRRQFYLIYIRSIESRELKKAVSAKILIKNPKHVYVTSVNL